ncbi:hypothetical protein CVT26_009250, partial [Gymnopilus dilepis]
TSSKGSPLLEDFPRHLGVRRAAFAAFRAPGSPSSAAATYDRDSRLPRFKRETEAALKGSPLLEDFPRHLGVRRAAFAAFRAPGSPSSAAATYDRDSRLPRFKRETEAALFCSCWGNSRRELRRLGGDRVAATAALSSPPAPSPPRACECWGRYHQLRPGVSTPARSLMRQRCSSELSLSLVLGWLPTRVLRLVRRSRGRYRPLEWQHLELPPPPAQQPIHSRLRVGWACFRQLRPWGITPARSLA